MLNKGRRVAAQIIYGTMEEVVMRKKKNENIHIGELLVVPYSSGKYIFQVFDMLYGSQIGREMIENISGKIMEQGIGEIKEKDIRNYILLKARNVLFIDNEGKDKIPKHLPPSFSFAYFVNEEDFSFLRAEEGRNIGKIRSGKDTINIDVKLDTPKWITHHIFIGATTGRGKSNLVKVMLWEELFNSDIGFLIIDPHDEYYGRSGKGLSAHEKAQEGLYYLSPSPPSHPNASSLKINISYIRPWDLMNVTEFSEAQQNAMYLAYAYAQQEGGVWIDMLLNRDVGLIDFIKQEGVQDVSIDVLRRKIINIIGAEFVLDRGELRVSYSSTFTDQGGMIVEGILDMLEGGKKVIIDTSSLTTKAEVLIISLLVNRVFERYKRYKRTGEIKEKANIGVLLEEAPRVINSSPNNIFETIAREGRKFNIGIVAITQLPSLIPSEILANMNTKILLGMEMEKERNIVISSSPQDLSKDSRIIASLDKGEGIITSIFTKFPIPFRAYNFDDILNEALKKRKEYRIRRRGFNESGEE